MKKIEPGVTQEELVSSCQMWQKALRLQDWDIVVKLVDTLPNGRVAEVSFNLGHRNAAINVASSFDETLVQAEFIDQERSLVHELLHLQYAAIDKAAEGSLGIVLEQGINATADLLLQMVEQIRQLKVSLTTARVGQTAASKPATNTAETTPAATKQKIVRRKVR